MLDELLKEISELKEYKRLYESQKIDKARMSEELFKLMTEKYNNQSYEERCEIYRKTECRDCRSRDYCLEDFTNKLPENILEPVLSDKEWIPGVRGCKSFEWS